MRPAAVAHAQTGTGHARRFRLSARFVAPRRVQPGPRPGEHRDGGGSATDAAAATIVTTPRPGPRRTRRASNASQAHVMECSVVLRRLPEAPPPPLPSAHDPRQDVRECRVVLERLVPSTMTTPATAPPDSTPAAPEWRRTLRRRVPPKQPPGGGGRAPRPGRGRRAAALRQQLNQHLAAVKVTQRSAWRRGRGRPPSKVAAPQQPPPADAAGSAPQDKLLRIACLGEMVKELLRAGSGIADTFAEYEKVVLRRWLELSEDAAATYIRLMSIKGPWIRGGRAALGADIQQRFVDLEKAGFVSNAISQCEVRDVAGLLRVDELEAVCADLGVPVVRRTKLAIVRSLVRLHSTGQAKATELQSKLRAALGGCARLRVVPRGLMERALLLLAAWLPAPADGRRLRAVRSLLLQPVPALLPLRGPDGAPLPQQCMFTTRQQALEWEDTASVREELETAIVSSNWPAVETATEELLEMYRAHLAASSLVDEAVGVRVLGSALAEALSAAADVLRRDKDLVDLAMESLLMLLGQRQHLQERRSSWAAAAAWLLQTRKNDHQGAAELLVRELEDGGHRGAPRADLEVRARALLRATGDTLAPQTLARLRRLVPEDTPPPVATHVIKATAVPGSDKTRGLKRVYVHRAAGADDKQHVTVEERVMAHFAGREYPQGVDDEGETLVSLAVLALWDVVYDAGVPGAWGSSCQDRPLDWATDRFWAARRETVEQRLLELQERADDVRGVAAELADARTILDGTPSLVRWPLLRELDVEVFLRCVTLPLFVAISRRIFLDFSSFRRGFPDLLLWNPVQSKSLFVEVKGPRDVVSPSQAQWLDFLQRNGADVAVADVRAT